MLNTIVPLQMSLLHLLNSLTCVLVTPTIFASIYHSNYLPALFQTSLPFQIPCRNVEHNSTTTNVPITPSELPDMCTCHSHNICVYLPLKLSSRIVPNITTLPNTLSQC